MIAGCVARVPVSLWGCGGRAVFAGRCVYVRNRSQPFATIRKTVLNRPQPSATVRNRSREGSMAVPIQEVLQKGLLLELSSVA